MGTERTEKIEEDACDWLIRRESGHWTEADQAQLERWLDASTLNRVAFLRLEHAWTESARLKALGAGISGDLPPPPGQWNLTPIFEAPRADSEQHDSGIRSVARARRLAIAASLLLTLTVGVGLSAYQFWGGGGDRYATPVGGLSSVPMSDGSKITLNTNSQLRVSMTEAECHVDLKRGEAFFEVAKDPVRPFVVEAGKKRVVAVGTKFSVRRDGESIEVVVTEGKVRVEDASRPLPTTGVEAAGSASAEGAGTVFLASGAIARADGEGVRVQRKSLQEAETHLSWRRGVLMFREQNLADIVAEFNRYNVRKVVVADPAVAGLKIEGNFRATNVDAFVRLLESGFPIRATAEEDRIVLSAR